MESEGRVVGEEVGVGGARPQAKPRRVAGFELASLALAFLAMLGTLAFGLLPLVLGLLGARAAGLALAGLGGAGGSAAGRLAASLAVGTLAAGVVFCAGMWAVEGAREALGQAPAIASSFAEKLLAMRGALPPGLAAKIPDDDARIQAMAAEAVSRALPDLAIGAKSWAGGALLAAIGWILGLLMVNMKPACPSSGPLALALRERGRRFADVFGRVVAGQAVVACANTFFAAVFMLGILPLLGERMPWAGGLIGLTFVLSMIPAAGNVLCNGVVTLVALSVGPGLAVGSLAYLILVHKIEYFINAKAVGSRSSIAVWELLLAMVAFERMFGVAGLVAAPMFYAYAKSELKSLGWI